MGREGAIDKVAGGDSNISCLGRREGEMDRERSGTGNDANRDWSCLGDGVKEQVLK